MKCSTRKTALYACTAASWAGLILVAALGFRGAVDLDEILTVILLGILTLALTLGTAVSLVVAPMIAAWRSGFASGLVEGRATAHLPFGAETPPRHLYVVDNS